MKYFQFKKKQVKCASKMQKAELLKLFEWTWNIIDSFGSSL